MTIKQSENSLFFIVVLFIATVYFLYQVEPKGKTIKEEVGDRDYFASPDVDRTEIPNPVSFDHIESRLVERLRNECQKPELFSVVHVERGLTKEFNGYATVDIKYWTVDDQGERQLRRMSAVLDTEGKVNAIRYHIQKDGDNDDREDSKSSDENGGAIDGLRE